MIPLAGRTISQVAADLAAGTYTSLEITEAYLARIAELNPALNVMVTVTADVARKQSAASDERRAVGNVRGPLDGIPYTLKDVFASRDFRTTASSRMLEDWQAPYNATTYINLTEAGAVCLGTTNTDEFTMGASTEHSAWGVTNNPWDTSKVAGGSSGGPAAAVAASFGVFAIGTDTGGSIRQPAHFCGISGLKPTYGRVSRFGELAMASSLDQTGPMAHSAEDVATVLQVLAGNDPLDATSLPGEAPNYSEVKSLQGMRVGVPTQFFTDGLHSEYRVRVEAAIEVLKQHGAEIVECSVPSLLHALAVYYILCPAEVSSNMARYDGIRYGHSIERSEHKHSLQEVYTKSRGEGLGAEVQRRIMMGAHVLSSGYHDAYYKKALAVRDQIRDELNAVLQDVDVLVGPVSPSPAFGVGEKVNDPLALYLEDVLTTPANIAGLPAMSVPCGLVDNLPVGLQIIGGHLAEQNVLSVATGFQAVTDFHTKLPNNFS